MLLGTWPIDRYDASRLVSLSIVIGVNKGGRRYDDSCIGIIKKTPCSTSFDGELAPLGSSEMETWCQIVIEDSKLIWSFIFHIVVGVEIVDSEL